jgi:predicted nucleotidyltransferase component of viral defense system
MLRAVDIRTISGNEGIDAGIIEKDYVLTKTLIALSRDSLFSESLVFKGGTVLKKCYFPDWRFSEDLDFTSRVKLTPRDIRGLFERTTQTITDTVGCAMRVIEYSQYPRKGENIISAQLKLGYDGPLQKTSGQKNNIRVDIALNEQIVEAPRSVSLIASYQDDSPCTLVAYSLNEILAEKLRSILQRGKSRDFYDVWALLVHRRQEFDLPKVWSVFVVKLESKDLEVPKSVDDFISPTRIRAARDFWRPGIAHQVRELPAFDTVISELPDVLLAAFGDNLQK